MTEGNVRQDDTIQGKKYARRVQKMIGNEAMIDCCPGMEGVFGISVSSSK